MMRYGMFLVPLLFLTVENAGADKIRTLATAPKPPLTVAEVGKIAHENSLGMSGAHRPNPGMIGYFDAMSYRYTGGRYEDQAIQFRLRTPRTIEPGKKYPLVVWFHGRGESGDDNLSQMSHMHFAAACLAGPESGDFYMLATQCPPDNREWRSHISREDGKGDSTFQITREIMDALITQYPVDEDRISVFGLSSGGEAAWQFVMELPERFSGLVCVSAIPPGGEPVVNMNIWVFCTNQDNAVPLEKVQAKVDEINGAGGSVGLTIVKKGGHDAWTEALRDYCVISWLVTQKRGAMLNKPAGFGPAPHSTVAVLILFVLPVFCLAVLILFSRKRSS